MAPNNNLIIDSATYGDVVHRDAYIRDKIQMSTTDISNYFYLVNGPTKTVPVLENVETLGDGLGRFNLYTAGTSTGVNTSSDKMLSITVAETDINSTIVNFAGTSINLSNPQAMFANLGSASTAGSTHLAGSFTVDAKNAGGADNEVSISALTNFYNDVNLNSHNLDVQGGTSNLGTVNVQDTLTANGNVSFVGTSFTNAGTTTLTGSTTLHDSLTLDNASASLTVSGPTILQSTLGVSSSLTVSGTTLLHDSLTQDNASATTTLAGPTVLQSTLGVSSAVTLNSGLSMVGTSSEFNNAGSTVLTGTTLLHDALTLDNASAALTVSGPTILQSTLGVASSLTADGSVSFVGTAFPFIVNGPTTINNSLDVTGTLSFTGQIGIEGDLDMKTNNIVNVASLKNTDNLHIDINSTLGEIDTYVGTGAQPIMSITSTGINVNGDITVLGQSFELQSTTVKVQDLNISLGYLADTLANCDGAGFTIGDSTKSYTLPSFTYQSSTNSFISNVDLRSVNGVDNTYCTLGSGVVKAYNSGGTKYASLEYDCVKFTDTWRMRYDDVNDCVKLEKFNGVDTWVTKFTFTS